MSFDADPESAWLQRTAGGDRIAFEQLYRAYHRRIFGYVFRMVGRADRADELASDVLLEVWKSAGRFKGESRVSTWIFGIARYKALSSLRRLTPEGVQVEEAGDIPDEAERQDEMLIKATMREAVQKAFAALSDRHREVMELTFYQGFSYPEIAEILGCPVNTVKTRMFHARKQLKELLSVVRAQ
jgi:RNA polymerase sigma-70 factor (ECF subfamily)